MKHHKGELLSHALQHHQNRRKKSTTRTFIDFIYTSLYEFVPRFIDVQHDLLIAWLQTDLNQDLQACWVIGFEIRSVGFVYLESC